MPADTLQPPPVRSSFPAPVADVMGRTAARMRRRTRQALESPGGSRPATDPMAKKAGSGAAGAAGTEGGKASGKGAKKRADKPTVTDDVRALFYGDNLNIL